MTFDAQSAAVEAVLDRHGILDHDRRRRIHKETVRRFDERATCDAVRVLTSEALGQGWRPPPSSCDVYESGDVFPVPIRQVVFARVLCWIRERPDFSVRDVMRASDWFQTAADARAVVDGLVARGEVEILAPPLRWPGERGRRPGTRYRAVPGGSASEESGSSTTREAAVIDGLDWSFLSDEI